MYVHQVQIPFWKIIAVLFILFNPLSLMTVTLFYLYLLVS